MVNRRTAFPGQQVDDLYSTSFSLLVYAVGVLFSLCESFCWSQKAATGGALGIKMLTSGLIFVGRQKDKNTRDSNVVATVVLTEPEDA
jgi:hypothetical protein